MADILKELKRPFDPKLVKWRVGGGGKKLAYIDSRDVMKRLDEVCGVDGWQAKYIPIDNGFICELSIRIDGEWVTKSNAAGYTKIESVKGGASDALKRAAVLFGVGRYLYYLTPSTKEQLPDWATPDGFDEKVVEKQADASSGMDSEEMYTISDIEVGNDRLKAIADATTKR